MPDRGKEKAAQDQPRTTPPPGGSVPIDFDPASPTLLGIQPVASPSPAPAKPQASPPPAPAPSPAGELFGEPARDSSGRKPATSAEFFELLRTSGIVDPGVLETVQAKARNQPELDAGRLA